MAGAGVGCRWSLGRVLPCLSLAILPPFPGVAEDTHIPARTWDGSLIPGNVRSKATDSRAQALPKIPTYSSLHPAAVPRDDAQRPHAYSHAWRGRGPLFPDAAPQHGISLPADQGVLRWLLRAAVPALPREGRERLLRQRRLYGRHQRHRHLPVWSGVCWHGLRELRRGQVRPQLRSRYRAPPHHAREEGAKGVMGIEGKWWGLQDAKGSHCGLRPTWPAFLHRGKSHVRSPRGRWNLLSPSSCVHSRSWKPRLLSR